MIQALNYIRGQIIHISYWSRHQGQLSLRLCMIYCLYDTEPVPIPQKVIYHQLQQPIQLIIISELKMKRKKGMSFDQKRQKMLSIFHSTKGVFNYQQVQNFSKKAGIPFPSVKEILQSLKADSLVECQKIGIGVFYWSFPSKAQQILIQNIEITEKQISTYSTQIQQLQKSIDEAKKSRQQGDEREQMIEQIKQLRKQESELEDEIEKYIRFDPQRYEFIKKQNEKLKLAVNNETDNIQQIKKYIKKQQIGIKNSQIQQCYGIPEDLDYIQ